MTKIVNLTPHVINAVRPDGSVANIPASGTVARVATKSNLVGTKNLYVEILGISVEVEIFETSFGEVVGLPEAETDTLFIVSGLVLDACKGTRTDLVAPGDLIRNSEGQPIGCKGFRKYSFQ